MPCAFKIATYFLPFNDWSNKYCFYFLRTIKIIAKFSVVKSFAKNDLLAKLINIIQKNSSKKHHHHSTKSLIQKNHIILHKSNKDVIKYYITICAMCTRIFYNKFNQVENFKTLLHLVFCVFFCNLFKLNRTFRLFAFTKEFISQNNNKMVSTLSFQMSKTQFVKINNSVIFTTDTPVLMNIIYKTEQSFLLT